MPYKIVQTTERGKKSLVIVPSFWEDNGNLWWPPKKTLFKLMKDEQSKPSKEWKIMKCILKRNNIQTYQLADDEISLMEETSDTDFQYNDPTAEGEPQETVLLPSQNQINFEVLAHNLTCNQENQVNSSNNYSNVTATENVSNNENVLQIFSAETVNFDLILANQKVISQKIDNMLQIQALALDNQRKLAQELAKQSVHLEEITVQLAEMKEGTNVTLLKDANPADNENFALKPIENQKELISRDQLLADKAEKNKLRQLLSFLCSSSNGTGITCAYKLLEILFTRDFLCLCSWAGGSRGDRSKIALKDYKNVLKFFHAMIQTWDPTYTVQDNENAIQRKSMKNLRMSSKRCRNNKANLDKRQKTGSKKITNHDTEGKSMQIEELVQNDDAKESEAENVPIEQENIPLNNIFDDENKSDLC